MVKCTVSQRIQLIDLWYFADPKGLKVGEFQSDQSSGPLIKGFLVVLPKITAISHIHNETGGEKEELNMVSLAQDPES